MQWRESTGVHRNIGIERCQNDAAHTIRDSGDDDGGHGIEVIFLRRGCRRNRNAFARRQPSQRWHRDVRFHVVGEGVVSVGNSADTSPRQPIGIPNQRIRLFQHGFQAITRHNRSASGAHPLRGLPTAQPNRRRARPVYARCARSTAIVLHCAARL